MNGSEIRLGIEVLERHSTDSGATFLYHLTEKHGLTETVAPVDDSAR